jgi:hypothetical protein
MRPPTHDDPHAIPRNGTDVPWVEIPDSGPGLPGSWGVPPAPRDREDPRSRRTTSRTAAQPGM